MMKTVIYLLASLPDPYEMLVTALEANTEVLSMEIVIERLLQEERKLKEKIKASYQVEMAKKKL